MTEVIANLKKQPYLVRRNDEKIKTKISPQFSTSLSKELYLGRKKSPLKRSSEANIHVDRDPKIVCREDEKTLKRDLSWPSMTSVEVSEIGSTTLNSATSSRCETPMSFLLSEDDFKCAESNLAHSLTKFSIETFIRGLYGVLVRNKSYDGIQLSNHSIIKSGNLSKNPTSNAYFVQWNHSPFQLKLHWIRAPLGTSRCKTID